MATLTSAPRRTSTGELLFLRGLPLWHVLLALAAILASVLLLGSQWERNWLRNIVLALAISSVPINLTAAWLMLRRNQLGRAIALLLNYVGAVACSLGLLGSLGAYTGLDTVADRFHGVVWLLAGVLLGYLIGAIGDRLSHDPRTQRRWQRSGNLVIIGTLMVIVVLMLRPADLAWLLEGLRRPLALGLLAGLLAFGLACWALWRPQAASLFGATARDAEILSGYLLIGPNLLGFLLFFAGPLLFSFFLSFTDSDSFSFSFTGLLNYARIFSLSFVQLADPAQRASLVLPDGHIELTRFSLLGGHFMIGAIDRLFWVGLWNTMVYCFWTTLLSVVPSLLIANLLNSKIPGMQVFRAIYFLPSVAGVVGVAVIWKWLYNSQVGFLNAGIAAIVNLVNLLPGVALPEPEIAWLARPETALFSIILMAAWQTLGINTILFLAGLQGIPREIYEAATVDGAGTWQRFRRMTLPLLAPTTFFVVTTTLIQTLQVFSEVVVMTPPPGGGPNNATLTSVLYLYQLGFQQFNQGYAAAVAWVLFLVIFLVTLLQFRIQRAYGEL